MSSRARAIAVEFFRSQFIQAELSFGRYKVAGEVGSLADRCAAAAKAFVEVEDELDTSGSVSSIAAAIVASKQAALVVQSHEYLLGVMRAAFQDAEQVHAHFVAVFPLAAKVNVPVEEEVIEDADTELDDDSEVGPEVEAEVTETPESDESIPTEAVEESSESTEGGLPYDVPAESLALPQRVKDALASQSTPEYELTTARKIREADKKRSLVELKDIGDVARQRILTAVDTAIGPES